MAKDAGISKEFGLFKEDGTPITFSKTALKEFSEDVDFVKGVLEAFRGFYGNAQSGN